MRLSDIPGGVPAHLTDAFQRRLLDIVRREAEGRSNDVKRGAETPALAATLFEKFAWGLTVGAQVIGIDCRAIQQEADELARKIDPNFEANKQARWAARPAGFLLGSKQQVSTVVEAESGRKSGGAGLNVGGYQECVANGSGPCRIGQHGPNGELQCEWCGEPPSESGQQSSGVEKPERCHAGKDGDCIDKRCPQLRDGEPHKSGRHCPLDVETP